MTLHAPPVLPIRPSIMATQPLTLGLLSPHNPFDRTSFSGSAFFAAKALADRPGIQLKQLLDHSPPRPGNWLLRRLGRKVPVPSNPGPKTLAGVDAVVGLVASGHLDQLRQNTCVPYIHVTDATPGFLRDAYGRTLPESIDKREARVIHQAAAVLYSSDMMADRARAEFGSGIPARVAPFGINFETLPASCPEKAPITPLELLFVGTDWVRKGGDIALQVLESLRRAGMDARLTLVGRLPKALRGHPAITCGGFLNKNRPTEAARLAALYTRAHLLLLPSRGDCTPMVVAEAMAHGTPVIATDTGGLPAMIAPGTGRILEQSAPPDTWVRAVQDLCADPVVHRCASQAAFAHANKTLTWENWAETVEKTARLTMMRSLAA